MELGMGSWSLDDPLLYAARLAAWENAPRLKLCGTWICDTVEGWGPMSPTREFDLTPCFQAVTLWVAPSLVFLFLAYFSLRYLMHRQVKERSEVSLHLLHEKDGITTIIALLGLVEIVVMLCLRRYATGEAQALCSGVQILAGLMTSLAYVCALLLQHATHLREQHGSDVAVLLWLTQLVAMPVRLRTLTQIAPWASLNQLLLVVPLFMRLILVIVVLTLELQAIDGNEGSISLPEDDEEGLLSINNGTEHQTRELLHPDPLYHPAPSPVESSNLFSRLTFQWMQPMMSLGAKRYLTESDMWALPKGEDTEALGDTLQNKWDQVTRQVVMDGRSLSETRRWRFWTSLFYSYGRLFMVAAIYKVIQDSLAFTQPQLLRALLSFVQKWEETDDPAQRGTSLRGYVLAFLLFFTAVVQMACLHQYFQLVSIAGMRSRAGVISAIFRKSLRLSNGARSERATGDIVNLMSVDANRLPDFVMYAHLLWSAVFQITIAFISLYNLLGWSAFVGVAIMVVSLPLNTVLATYLRRLSAEMMKVKDRRTQVMNEIILNIKSIKLFAWEQAFTERLLKIRDGEELPLLRKVGIASAGFNFFWQAIPFFVSLGTFIAFSLTSDRPLTADIVFPALSLYQLLNFPLSMLAGIVSMFLQTQVSADRLASFFDAEELDPDAHEVVPVPDSAERPASQVPQPKYTVEVRDACFKWSETQDDPTLNHIDLYCKPGELIGVLGRVGDGKSSLLQAIIGEMVLCQGHVKVHGEIAYFSQGGWCMGASIRDNILFGREFNEKHYKQCLFACALEPDLKLLKDGDHTEIGERGVSLSGGQRARVALARACYACADVYLLDDPLAAVDAHVGAHIWKHVLSGSGILAGRTRILTLNAVSYLSGCDKIISLRKGALLEEQGTFDEVMKMQGDVYRLITGLGQQSSQDPRLSTPQSEVPDPVAQTQIARPRELAKDEVKVDTIRQLRQSTNPQEKRGEGNVKWAVYREYIESASKTGVALFFCAHILTQIFSVSRDVVLKQWSAANEVHPPEDQAGLARFYLMLYGAVGLVSALGFCIAPFILYVWLVLSSARQFHNRLFLAVMRYPLQWFESTPTGRLLNLFSRDISVIDETLPRVIQGFVRSFMVVLSVICIVSYSVPSFLLFVIPLGFLYRAVMRYYLASSRELKRIDATSKSPVFTWFQESLGGLTNIRAYDQTAMFTDAFEARVDRNQMCYFPAITCNRWLAVRIELLGSSVIFFASTVAVFVVTTSGAISAGLLGLMLSQVLSTTQTLNWAVRSASEVEQNIVSVERVKDYSELRTEAPLTLPSDAEISNWPNQGVIAFEKYGTRYREDHALVLKDVSFQTRPSERVGVVGRTGAGKSSLTLALFRILEAVHGKILIDGIDISTLGLHELRDAVAIIPQDPQLWQGTLRDNLDPLHRFSEEQILRVLDQARLKSLVDQHVDGLDQPVSEGGTNLSAGQRQLVCIARALVRQTKILVLDEATSSVDLETDSLVQHLVRTQFHGTTITIAHRLNTILDSDRVLVMQDGSVKEFDTPNKLLGNRQSLFYSMTLEAGLYDAIKAVNPSVQDDLYSLQTGSADKGSERDTNSVSVSKHNASKLDDDQSKQQNTQETDGDSDKNGKKSASKSSSAPCQNATQTRNDTVQKSTKTNSVAPPNNTQDLASAQHISSSKSPSTEHPAMDGQTPVQPSPNVTTSNAGAKGSSKPSENDQLTKNTDCNASQAKKSKKNKNRKGRKK
ncbi:hypothetical protein MYAM1_000259 [Malassezia yamatoensis]|uniref:Metal resistance protein YCF1 n=1 Tax=Malassezia yamatoensis TaxID=253288 RepID=A0AAJ5YNZ7_9BASI|nr:hypothetical protein MYAM1_000259 [Malassezia yamatoensis]